MPFLRRRAHVPPESELQPQRMSQSVVQETQVDGSPPPPPAQRQDSDMESTSHDLQSRASSASQRPDATSSQEEANRHKRFSLLRFRNASDSQLSLRAKQQAEKPPPVPRRMLPPLRYSLFVLAYLSPLLLLSRPLHLCRVSRLTTQ